MMKIGIISYHRPECITVRTLRELGMPLDDVTIFIQDKKDLDAYRMVNKDVNIELFEGKGVSQNRNNVLKYDGYKEGDRVLLLDDDIVSFKKMSVYYDGGVWKCKSKKILEGKTVIDIVNSCFKQTDYLGSIVFGIAATENPFVAVGRLTGDGEYSINKLFQGGLIGHIIDKKTYYDESFNSVEDYEFQLRQYRQGKIVLRRNDITVAKKKNRGYRGGLQSFYESGGYVQDIDKLCAMYPRYVKQKKDYSGVTQISG